MPCGCIDNKLNDNKSLNKDKLSLDTMKGLSIDEITSLYRQGYVLENTESVESGIVYQSISNIESMTYGTDCTGSIVVDRHLESTGSLANMTISDAVAQRFVPTSRCLKSVTLRLMRVLDNDVYVEIRTDSGGSGALPVGNPQTSGNRIAYATIPWASIPTSLGEVTVPLNIILPDTSPVWIVTCLYAYDAPWCASQPCDTSYYVDGGGTGTGTSAEYRANKYGVDAWTKFGSLWFKTNKQTYSPPIVCPTPVVSVTCPTSPINQGSIGNIVATITTAGTPNYTYKLYVDAGTTPVDTFGPTTATSHTFSHTFSESSGSHTYKAEVTDSCTTPKSATGSCATTIQAALGTITFNVTSAGSPLSGVAISVDGTPRGETGGSGILAVPNLTIESSHIYIATKSGYNTVSGSTYLDTTAITVPISMTTPANITATSITGTPSDPCIFGSCAVNVSVRWTNNGQATGSIIPNITIDGFAAVPIPLPENMIGGAILDKTFIVTGLTAGSHDICPSPA